MQKKLTEKTKTSVDSVIIGGGIAGVWLLRLLSQNGYNAILLEQDALGSGQTLSSQGMIHGGLKYALSGLLSKESEAIAEMPRRWKQCLYSKNGEIDLRKVTLLSQDYYDELATAAAYDSLRQIQKLARKTSTDIPTRSHRKLISWIIESGLDRAN